MNGTWTEPPVQKLEPPAFTLRPGTVADQDFVAKSWAGTIQGAPAERSIEDGFFNRCIYPVIRGILKRDSTSVTVAAQAADPDVIYAFKVMEPALIHIVYVRRDVRRRGLAKALLADVDLANCDWSTQSSAFVSWIRHKYTLRHYRPFWAVEGDVYG